jgi:hypothetical protein
MMQTTMTGEDWLSDRDKRTQARAEAARRKAGQKCAQRLHAAADALGEFAMACLECNDASAPRRADDGRTLLASHMREYAGWLESVYGEKA